MKLSTKWMLAVSSAILVGCGGGTDDEDRRQVLVTPPTATVKTQAILQFSASVTGSSNADVTWAADGGTMTPDGYFIAPKEPGTYRIIATSRAEASKSATAIVTVRPRDKVTVRVFHASPDTPKFNALLDDLTASDLEYQKSSGSLSVDEGFYYFAGVVLVPGASATELIRTISLELMPKTHYDVVAVNTVDKIEALVLRDTGSLSDKSKVRVRIAHWAAAAPEVKVFVTPPGANLASATALGSLSFKGTLGPVELPAGNHQVRVTLPDNTVVFDSGPVALTAGKDLLIGAVPRVGAGSAPIQLAVLDGGDVAVISDKAAGTN